MRKAARFRPLAFALAGLLAPGGDASAQLLRDDGWWVVLTSIKDDGGMGPHRQIEAFRQKMRGCGVDIFNDYSAKFIGFSPGYLVAVTGAYGNEAQAKSALAKARPCAPGAYVKRARYAGG